MTDERIWFRAICATNGLNLSELQIEQFEAYVAELLSWNTKINLISRKMTDHVWSRHILGSMSFQFHFDLPERCKVLDLGTGGGLPGIPIAILNPKIQVTLLDSIAKKIKAVNEIISALKLANVNAVCARAEELKAKDSGSKFDFVISRAVAPVADLVMWSRPLISGHSGARSEGEITTNGRQMFRPGSIIMLKGGDITEELEIAKRTCHIDHIESYPLTINGFESEDLLDKKLIIV